MKFIKKHWFCISYFLMVFAVLGFSYLVSVQIHGCLEKSGGVRQVIVDSGKAVKSIIKEIAEDSEAKQ